MDLSTCYMGLRLPNPIVVSSCGLTQTLEGVRRCADAGAGAVVLKSIFEEQVRSDADAYARSTGAEAWHPEAEEYLSRFSREETIGRYLKLIREAKAAVSIPVIASIHCVTAGTWTDFASRIEQAGADALELNVFVLPADPRRHAKSNEQVYFDVARAVTRKASIPVALKIGSYFSGLSHTLIELSRTGVGALVLFNRFLPIDVDIEKLELVPGKLHSGPDDYVRPLRWISVLSGRMACDLAASGGVHDGAAVVKQLLAGATAVQVCSALYEHDVPHLGKMLEQLQDWMRRHDFESIEAFRGRLRQRSSDNPAAYERVQFMKATSGVE
jgi:dihydroorotate dehydrogenase (fumarate)